MFQMLQQITSSIGHNEFTYTILQNLKKLNPFNRKKKLYLQIKDRIYLCSPDHMNLNHLLGNLKSTM